jgi:hypothetical protein
MQPSPAAPDRLRKPAGLILAGGAMATFLYLTAIPQMLRGEDPWLPAMFIGHALGVYAAMSGALLTKAFAGDAGRRRLGKTLMTGGMGLAGAIGAVFALFIFLDMWGNPRWVIAAFIAVLLSFPSAIAAWVWSIPEDACSWP